MINSLSVIFPLYNEAKRLHHTFKDIEKFEKKKIIKNVEYIFVNDGSNDDSKKIIYSYLKLKKSNKFKVINIKKNKGKGNALKKGIINSKKDWILTLDTDISVSILQLNEWIRKNYLNRKVQIYFGSRNLNNSKVEFKLHRKILGIVFSFILKLLLKINIKDTQCGFKLYENKKAKFLFKKIKDDGFVHDVEISLLSKKYNLKLKELPVKWSHKKDSKINLFTDTIEMFYKLIVIRKYYI